MLRVPKVGMYDGNAARKINLSPAGPQLRIFDPAKTAAESSGEVDDKNTTPRAEAAQTINPPPESKEIRTDQTHNPKRNDSGSGTGSSGIITTSQDPKKDSVAEPQSEKGTLLKILGLFAVSALGAIYTHTSHAERVMGETVTNCSRIVLWLLTMIFGTLSIAVPLSANGDRDRFSSELSCNNFG